MKGRNGAAKPPAQAPAPARAGRASRNGAPVETFSRFVSQLANRDVDAELGRRGPQFAHRIWGLQEVTQRGQITLMNFQEFVEANKVARDRGSFGTVGLGEEGAVPAEGVVLLDRVGAVLVDGVVLRGDRQGAAQDRLRFLGGANAGMAERPRSLVVDELGINQAGELDRASDRVLVPVHAAAEVAVLHGVERLIGELT